MVLQGAAIDAAKRLVHRVAGWRLERRGPLSPRRIAPDPGLARAGAAALADAGRCSPIASIS
jgi:hypothetical protein